MEKYIGESARAISSGIVVVWKKPLCFVIKLFGIPKLGMCENGNFITKCGKRTSKAMMSGCGEQHIFIWGAAYIQSLSSSLWQNDSGTF